jgi:BTB/POZ domain
VTFTLGESGDELKGHKFFLMTASPVFHQLFVNNADAAESNPIDLKISAISKTTMTEICRFAYSETINLTKENMLDVLFAASKFQMKFLMEKTIDFICKDGMNENSVFKILELNQKENNMRINIKSFEYIQKNHQKCFKSSEFLAVSSDLLRAIMQTCKIPRTAAKAGIALWSAFPDNSDDDLDELIALVSLNDDVEESTTNAPAFGSDSESVNSCMSSRAGSTVGGNRQNRHRGGRHQNNLQHNGNFNDNGQGNQQNFSNNQQRGNANRRPPKSMPNMAQQQQFIQQQQHLLHQQMQMGLSTAQNFILNGKINRKHCTYANLNLSTLSQPISITEIHFIYDLSTTDKEFELRIVDLTGKKTDLFYSRVSTSDKFNGVFTRYVLPRPCQIDSARKLWISIEFMKPEFRLSYDNHVVSPDSSKGCLELRRESITSASAQIIANIVYCY